MKARYALLGLGLLLFCGSMVVWGKRLFVQPDDAGRVEAPAVPPVPEAEAEREAVEDVIEEVEAPVLMSRPVQETAVRIEEADAVLSEGSALSENPDYRGGNGTILTYAESDWVRKIIRKCEMDVTIGGMLNDEGHTVYESIARKNAVGLLQDGDRVSLLQQCTLEYLQEPKSEYGSERGDLWYKLRLADGSDGWICTNDEYLYSMVPYYGNSYELLGTVHSGGKTWTVRKLEQTLSVFEALNIRDKPGLDGSVLYTIRPGESDPVQTNVHVTAVTEEEDTVDGMTDRWVRVSYGDCKGWVFGGYTSAERGGPKYFIPEQLIAFDLGDLP